MKAIHQPKPAIRLTLVIAVLALLAIPTTSAQAPKRFVAQLGGASYAIAATDTLVCAGVGPNLAVFSAESTELNLLGSVYLGDIVRGLTIDGNLVYVAASGQGLRIVSLANPAAPLVIGGRDELGSVLAVAVANDYAYVGNENGTVHVLDVHDPVKPVWTDSVATPGQALDIETANSYAFVADGRSGLYILRNALNQKWFAVRTFRAPVHNTRLQCACNAEALTINN
nr:hypothetical protein [Chloroflexota bacterium]